MGFEEYNVLRKEASDSSFQSWTVLVKLGFQWVEVPQESKYSETKASLFKLYLLHMIVLGNTNDSEHLVNDLLVQAPHSCWLQSLQFIAFRRKHNCVHTDMGGHTCTHILVCFLSQSWSKLQQHHRNYKQKKVFFFFRILQAHIHTSYTFQQLNKKKKSVQTMVMPNLF